MKGMTRLNRVSKKQGPAATMVSRDWASLHLRITSALRTPPPTPNRRRRRNLSAKWGDQGSSVVDLRCLGLDPNKPIVLDPHVVRGQERVFPAQIDPATFENANYNNGFAGTDGARVQGPFC